MNAKVPRFFWFAPAITFALGTWQCYRWQWKRQLIADMTRELREPVREHDSVATAQSELHSLLHRRLIFRGQWATGENGQVLRQWIGPRVMRSPLGHRHPSGFYLYQLLLLNDGKSAVWVNRGWVPNAVSTAIDAQDGAESIKKLRKEHVRLVGVVRPVSSYMPGSGFLRKWFLPSSSNSKGNQQARLEWIWPDLPAMTATLPPVQETIDMNYMVEQVLEENVDFSSMAELQSKVDPCAYQGEPIRKLADVQVPNKHMEYIVTWYSMTGILVWMLKRRRFSPR